MVVRKIKEKCKDAARMRREKERAEFVELSKLLPLPSSITSQLDKASVIRLTSCYLKMRSAFPRGLGHNWGANSRDQHQQHHQPPASNGKYSASSQPHSGESTVRELGSLLLQTLDGFVFALHKDGKIMYISETASVLLGLPQIDLAGSSIFDYVLPADHNDIHEALNPSEAELAQLELANHHNQTTGGELELPRAFCMRMKCILPKRNAGLVSAGHKAIHCNGYLKLKQLPRGTDGTPEGGVWQVCAMVAFGHSLLPTASTEVKLNASSFMFRVNLDLTLYFIEASFTKLLGFEQSEMTGQSLYKFVHASDLGALESSHKSVLEKGQVVTRYYRLMKRTGGCIWVQSHATLVNNPRNMPRPQHIVSVCQVLADDSSSIDESCILNEPCDQQVINIQTTLGGKERNQDEQKQANGCQLQAGARHKRLKIACGGEYFDGSTDDNDSNINYISPNSSSLSTDRGGHTYMTIGSTRRISDDTSSIASSATSSQLASSTTVSVVTLPPESQATKAYLVANTAEYYSNQPHTDEHRSQQNLELQSSNSLESIPISYYDTCTRYEETSPRFNTSINVPQTYSKQTSFSDVPLNYNHLTGSCQEYCSCSRSPDWSNRDKSLAKSNLLTTCQIKDQTHSIQQHPINIYHQDNQERSSTQLDEQVLPHYNDYTYYVDTPYLMQCQQQVPINNGYGS